MRALNLIQVQAFLDVLDLGSFSAAAEKAGLSQPAVSHQVRELERHLQVALFERTGRRVRPTTAGLVFAGYARRLADVRREAEAEMSLHASGALGRVRIGAGATACIHLLPPVLKDLKQRLPSMEIVIRTGNADEMAKAVQNDTLDIGLLTLPVSGRSLEIVPVFEEAFVAIGPADQNWPATVDPNTLASSPLILYERGGNTRRLADEWLAAGGARIEPLMSLGDVEAIKELVGSGLGCSILPSLSVSRRSRRRNLAVRRLDPPLARTLALVVRKDKILRRSLRETIRAIRAIQPGASSGLANSTATIKTMP